MKETPEKFLQAIYLLAKKEGKVKSIEVGKMLNLTRPEVFRSLKTLKDFGFIDQKPYGKILITEKGREKAKKMLCFHKGLTKFLTDFLSLPVEEAGATAYSIEHILSEEAIHNAIAFLKSHNLIEEG